MIKQLIASLALGLGVVGGVTANAASLPHAATSNGNVTVSVIPIQNGPAEPAGESWIEETQVAGTDGAYYAAFRGLSLPGIYEAIYRFSSSGNATLVHAFSALNVDPSGGFPTNDDGAFVSGLVSGGDGNVYGITDEGGAYGFGTFFRVTPDGTYTVLNTFDFRSYNPGQSYRNWSVVSGPGGAFYGIATLNNQNTQLYKLSTDGTYTVLCNSPSLAGLSPAAVAGDGTIYGLNSGVFKLAPDCTYTQIYTTTSNAPTSLILGNDGNLYMTSWDFIYLKQNTSSTVLKLTTSGAVTPLRQFDADMYSYFQPGGWVCEPGYPICGWQPGSWQVAADSINADGWGPTALIQGRDGNIYGVTTTQGLSGRGTLFRVSPQGDFSTVLSFPSYPSAQAGLIVFAPLMQDPQGNLVSIEGEVTNPALVKLTFNQPLSATISFSKPTVKPWQPTVLSWSSTGVQSCQLISDVPGLKGGSVGTTGSKTIDLLSKGSHTPPVYTAGLQCTAADGSVANAAATVTIQ
jgi:uncharacterized repeat protein (TIGR03803 family)